MAHHGGDPLRDGGVDRLGDLGMMATALCGVPDADLREHRLLGTPAKRLRQKNALRYLEVVDEEEDDFQELSELLFGAKERYRSARATITHTVVGSVAQESNRRFVDWRFAQPGGSGMGILRTDEERRAHGPDVPRDFYLEYEDTEEVYT